ncbi:MAG TPA: alkaline phosphatase [Candidatus Latescibacteria bacterium]|nr:alkaline phosphatase [Candidatus Latescibacterota bacterium]
MKRRIILLVCVVVSVGTAWSANWNTGRNPKNVIILVGDGMGFNQVEAGSLFLYGESGRQVFERFPVRYGCTTFSASGNGYQPDSAWTSLDYLKKRATDSGAAATAIATGTKTTNGAIGVAPDGNPVQNILEVAEDAGMATGVVSSVGISHATPAGFVAHSLSRGSLESIAQEMILGSRVDVIMGAGNPWFDDNGNALAEPKSFRWVGGEQVWKGLLLSGARFDLDTNGTYETTVADADGDGVPDRWELVQTRRAFQQLAVGRTPNRVLGLPQIHETLQQKRTDQRGSNLRQDYANDEPYAVPLNEKVPTLAEMTRAAINVLDNDPDGFVLMVEGGAIDWAGHSNLGGRVIEEMVSFTEAIEAVVAWVDSASSWDETLVVVTADHETGYLWGPGTGPGADGAVQWNPLQGRGPRRMPAMQWNSTGHTNSLVPFFAKGKCSDRFARFVDGTDPRYGQFVDNTVIFRMLTED